MFELNLATLPNSILYIEGVQLSYIKVYVHIFNIWHAQKPCFISNPEFAKRTGLHRDTVINAIQFFEKHGLLKRVMKNGKRYLVQPTRFIETESVDKSTQNCTNIDTGSELDQGGVGVRPPPPSELDHHNNKINNKINKSFCVDNVQEKIKSVDNSPPPQTAKPDINEKPIKKHTPVEKPKPTFSDPTKQSTSYKRPVEKKNDTDPHVIDTAMLALPHSIRPKRYRDMGDSVQYQNNSS